MINWKEHIISDEKVLLGKPVIKGTRISVDLIIGRLADGWSVQDILESYPSLKMENVLAIFAYLHECMEDGLLFNHLEKTA
ncbi:MAG: DUF433 domain-containing protein [Bacteroidota bacterium]